MKIIFTKKVEHINEGRNYLNALLMLNKLMIGLIDGVLIIL